MTAYEHEESKAVAALMDEVAYDSSGISEQPFGEDATVEVHYYLDLGGVVIEGIAIKGQGYVDAWAFSDEQLSAWTGWIEEERRQIEEREAEHD